MLGAIIERAADAPLEDAFAELVAGPLGLTALLPGTDAARGRGRDRARRARPRSPGACTTRTRYYGGGVVRPRGAVRDDRRRRAVRRGDRRHARGHAARAAAPGDRRAVRHRRPRAGRVVAARLGHAVVDAGRLARRRSLAARARDRPPRLHRDLALARSPAPALGRAAHQPRPPHAARQRRRDQGAAPRGQRRRDRPARPPVSRRAGTPAAGDGAPGGLRPASAAGLSASCPACGPWSAGPA